MPVRRFFFILTAVILYSIPADGQRGENVPGLFRNGDRICFIGNSITHAGTYHSLIYLYYLTRYPERRIEVYNCGISGDVAGGALARFTRDISVHNPSFATIKLGTNDVVRSLYNSKSKPDQAAKNLTDATYRKDMRELARRLDSIHSEIIFLTPAFYEERRTADSTLLTGLNDAFVRYGRFLDSLRVKYNARLVDFHFIMDSISVARQKLNPAFTLNRSDRVHPEYDGHFIMAFSFIRALNNPSYVSRNEIDARRKSVSASDNCSVSDLHFSRREISFNCLEKSLPFPVSAYPKDTTLVPFTQLFNREILQIRGLESVTRYSLSIDSVLIGDFRGKQLGEGLNLALMSHTPQSVQSQKVASLNEQRRKTEAQIRDLKFIEYQWLEPGDLYLDKAAVTELLNRKLENYKTSYAYSYFKGLINNYLENSDKYNNWSKSIERLVDEIYISNKPVIHRYSLKIITPSGTVKKRDQKSSQ